MNIFCVFSAVLKTKLRKAVNCLEIHIAKDQTDPKTVIERAEAPIATSTQLPSEDI